jgi:hypothetical protein
MLNLDVCDKCIRKAFSFSKGIRKDSIRKSGEISCPPDHWKTHSLYGAPPELCPYKLEHAVSEGMTKDAR